MFKPVQVSCQSGFHRFLGEYGVDGVPFEHSFLPIHQFFDDLPSLLVQGSLDLHHFRPAVHVLGGPQSALVHLQECEHPVAGGGLSPALLQRVPRAVAPSIWVVEGCSSLPQDAYQWLEHVGAGDEKHYAQAPFQVLLCVGDRVFRVLPVDLYASDIPLVVPG